MTPTIAEVREALLCFDGIFRSTMAARLDPDTMVIVTFAERDALEAVADAANEVIGWDIVPSDSMFTLRAALARLEETT